MNLKENLIIKNFGPIKEIELGNIAPFLFLIGESGSGKSTILKVLAMMRHIYKQLTLRSYLKMGGVTAGTIVLAFDEYLHNGGMNDYVTDETEIIYSKGECIFSFTKKNGLQGTKSKMIPSEALSLEKISFLSDKRGAIASLLANNNDGAALGFYFQETFRDFKEAVESIHAIDIPFLKIRYYEKKARNNARQFFIGNPEEAYDIHFEDASSGIQTMTPLTLIAEYFSRKFDIVKETNRSVVNLLGKNDSLASFKHDMNIGDIANRAIHLFIEEPELSLFPKAQRSSINMLVRKCKNANTHMTLSIATHSPYIINHLNLLMKACDKGVLVEGASLDYSQTNVYVVENGGIRDIKVQNAHLVDTDRLSDDINEIYDEYNRLDEIAQ
mgnify:FL=1